MQTAEIMTRTVVSIGRRDTVRDAIRLMLEHRISGLPVMDDAGNLVGILTEGDLVHRGETGTQRHRRPWLEFLLGPGRLAEDYVKSHGRRVEEVMTREVVSIGPNAPVGELVQLMERRRIKRLPVLDGGRLVGIVSRADLMGALAQILDRDEAVPTDDETIRELVLGEFERAQGWGPRSGVAVGVADGIVELNGAIFDEKERVALRVAAENVPGVKGVVDRLVWVEPVSGTVFEPPEPEAPNKPA